MSSEANARGAGPCRSAPVCRRRQAPARPRRMPPRPGPRGLQAPPSAARPRRPRGRTAAAVPSPAPPPWRRPPAPSGPAGAAAAHPSPTARAGSASRPARAR